MSKKKLKPKSPSLIEAVEIQNPSIGIVGWNSPRFALGHQRFMDILKNSIVQKQGSPLFFGISGSLDPTGAAASNGKKEALHYGLPSRDIIADQIELIISNEQLSGLVLIPWSVNSLVGMLMACSRSAIPAVFLPSYALWEAYRSREVSALAYNECSMPLLLEVLGFTRMGILEGSFKKKPSDEESAAFDEEFSQWGAQRILEMIKQKVSSRRFFSSESFRNSVCVDIALGGCTDTLLHLSAIFQGLGVPSLLQSVNELSKKVPMLVPMDKSGEFKMEEFIEWGGLEALLSTLISFLQPSQTVTGRNIVDVIKSSSHTRSSFKLNHPYGEQAPIGVLAGSLARDGALLRTAPLKKEWLAYSGPAKVFNGEAQCLEAVHSKKIKKGDVLVLRYCGPRGSAGMPALTAIAKALRGKNLEESVAVVTDGRLESVEKLAAIVHVSPEAAVGGPIAVVQDGDILQWNFQEKSLHLRLTDTEVRVRLSRWKEQDQRLQNSLLERYLKYSSSSSLGATLK